MPGPKYCKAVLDNGVTLVGEKHEGVRSLSIGAWVRVGSRYETPSENGISHFIEHMVFKGTENRQPLEIATALECLGGDLNAFTDRELTCYHATVLSEHVETGLDVLSDILFRPTFPKEQLERERKVLLQELSMIEDAPEDWIADAFFKLIWKDQPLGQPVIGTRETIQAISRAKLTGFYEKYYQPENLTVSVAGNFDFEKLKSLCEKYFVKDRAKGVPKKNLKPTKYQSKQKIINWNAEQMHLLIGFEGIGFKDPFRFDALILSFFLGGGMSSRLFQEIREKAALAYSVDCDCIPFTDTGVFTISAGMLPKSIKHCLEIVGREINNLRDRPLENSALDLIKGQLRGTILLSSDQMETRQESLGRNELVFGRYLSVDEVIAEIDRVSPERVHELARRIFVPEKETVVTLGKGKPRKEDLSVFR